MSISTIRLGDVVEVVMGQAPPGDACNKDGDGTVFIKAGEFQERFPIVREWTTTPLKLSRPDDVLVCVVGATAGKVNQSTFDCAIGRSVAAVRAIYGKLNSDFLFHFLKTKVIQLRNGAQGAAQGVITREMIHSLPLMLPALSEQVRIAAILDQADAIRAKRRESLAQLDNLTQSIFIEMFGRNKAEKSIGKMLDDKVLLLHKDGNHGSMYPRADDFGTSGISFLSAKCITEEGLIDDELIERLRDEIANKLKIGWIQKGDVLLSHNASVGKVALYDGRFSKALIGTSLTAFRPNPVFLNSQFLAASLQSSGFQRQLQKNMGQTTRNQVPITAQRELKIPLPPIEAQLKFAQKLSVINKQKELNQAALVEQNYLFASLQHRAFRGEL